ncbi:MAG TPA: HNH endonuclease signature motif containing protein, partial [Natronosporangium sp.]
ILTTHPTPDLDRDPDRRRPTAAQAAFVRARDRTCRAPGCRTPAHTCDIDHTQPWADGGKTTTSNLGCLCRTHHLFRHATGTQLTQLSPGVFSWQTPHGLQYLVRQDPPLLSLNQPHI